MAGRRKTYEELKPARVIHRLGEVLQNVLEAQREDFLPVDKRMYGKQVYVGNKPNEKLVAFTVYGVVHWTQFAIERYTEQDRIMAKAFSES